jgi:NADH:ubiquinone oxidoreductase subunit 6 (subunit J)
MISIFYLLKFSCLIFALLITFYNQNPIYSVLNLIAFFVIGSILLLLLSVDFLSYVFIIVYAGAVAVLFLFVVIILKIKLGSTKTNYLHLIFIILLSFFLSSLTYTIPHLNKININKVAERYHEFPPIQDILLHKNIGWCDPNLTQFLPLVKDELYLKTTVPCDLLEKGPLQKFKLFCFKIPGKRLNLKHVYLNIDNAILCSQSDDGKRRLLYPLNIDKADFSIDEDFIIYDTQSSLINLGKIIFTEYYIHFIISGLILLVAIVGAISLTIKIKSISLKQKIYKQTSRCDAIGKISIE